MALYKYIEFKIGSKIFAIDINSVYRFFKVKDKLLPYPGENEKFQFIMSLQIGSIPILRKDFAGVKGETYNYLIVGVYENKKFGILCDEIIDLTEEIDKKTEIIDIKTFV